MILTESRLKQIIAEEIDNLLSEEQLDEAMPKWLRNLGAAAGLTAAGYFGGQATGDQGIPRDTGTIVAKDDAATTTARRPRPKPDDDSKKTSSKPKKIKKAAAAKPDEPDRWQEIASNFNLDKERDKEFLDVMQNLYNRQYDKKEAEKKFKNIADIYNRMKKNEKQMLFAKKILISNLKSSFREVDIDQTLNALY